MMVLIDDDDMMMMVMMMMINDDDQFLPGKFSKEEFADDELMGPLNIIMIIT